MRSKLTRTIDTARCAFHVVFIPIRIMLTLMVMLLLHGCIIVLQSGTVAAASFSFDINQHVPSQWRVDPSKTLHLYPNGRLASSSKAHQWTIVVPPMKPSHMTCMSSRTMHDGDRTDQVDPPYPSFHLIFPGGGLYFYWQAGVITYLRQAGYDLGVISRHSSNDKTTSFTQRDHNSLSSVTWQYTGASAGSLTATLTAYGVDFERATALALDLCQQAGVWDRSAGLQGIWGAMIETWLDELLPKQHADDHKWSELKTPENVSTSLALLVSPWPQAWQKYRVDSFHSRHDLIQCCMASVHLPWFLDGRWTRSFRSRPCIDGSFLASTSDYHGLHVTPDCDTIILDYKLDPKYRKTGLVDFVNAVSPKGIWQLLHDGQRYGSILEEQGVFSGLPKREVAC